MESPAVEQTGPEDAFYYTVLNVDRAAAQNEINERHRALSLIFHPDKQRDEGSKEVANKKFLEIQKAYSVLSDPFLREVYDTLGERGLAIRFSPDARSLPKDTLRKLLLDTKQEMKDRELREQVLPFGTVACGIDATSLFDEYMGSASDSVPTRLAHRMQDVRLINCEVKYNAQKKLSPNTTIRLESSASHEQRRQQYRISGAVRHQFSPRLSSEANVGLFWPHLIRLATSYDYQGTNINVKVSSALARLTAQPPAVSASISRRLFRRRLEVASLDLSIGPQPKLSINLISPKVFGLPSRRQSDDPQLRAPSVSGFEYGSIHRKFGLAFTSILPSLVAELGVHLPELSLQLTTAMEWGLTGASWVCSGSWSNSTSNVGLTSVLQPGGLSLRLDLEYSEQRVAIPIIISTEPDPDMAIWTALVPSTLAFAGYHFILKPRRRKQRMEHLRAARKAAENDSGLRREQEAVVALLKESSRRIKQAETSKRGLIIIEATYRPVSTEDQPSELSTDVAVPLQALVRNSQLYISAEHSRPSIQGFTDPAPFARKMLSIRYLFGDRLHYAEIPDTLPIVLPLKDHLAE